MTRLRVSLLAAFLFALLLSRLAPAAALQGPVEITLLHTSDVHAHLMPFACASGPAEGGYARLAAYADRLRAQGRQVVLLSSGDVFQGTLFWRFFRGIPDAAFMRRMGFAGMALGNHEFDGGQSAIVDAFRDAGFPILSANLRFTACRELQDLKRDSAIHEVRIGTDTLRLGLIGVTEENLENDVPRPFLQGIVVESAEAAIARELPRLKSQGADAVIVLAHLGWPHEVRVAERFPEVCGVFGGHTHLFVDPPLVKEVPNGHQFLTESGEFGGVVTRLDLRLTPGPDGARVEVLAGGLMPLSTGMPEDPVMKAEVDALWRQVEGKVNIPLATAPERLEGDRPFIRQQETNLGNLAADSMLDLGGADIAVLNGGGIRTSIATGTVTIGDCLNVLPFDNYLIRLTMTGASVQRLFEQVRGILATTPVFGGFLHVSRGLQVRYGPAGAEVRLDGRPLDPGKNYTLITNDFLSNGGNGLSVFTEAVASESTGVLQADALMQYVKKLGTIDARVEGRIVVEAPLARLSLPRWHIQVPRPRD